MWMKGTLLQANHICLSIPLKVFSEGSGINRRRAIVILCCGIRRVNVCAGKGTQQQSSAHVCLCMFTLALLN